VVEQDNCLKLLQRLLAITGELGWLHHEIQVLILQAMAYYASHENSAALQALHQALIKAEPGGYVRLFTGEGRIMGVLLKQLVHLGINGDYGSHLLKVLLKDDTNLQTDLVEPLSKRELEVLEFLNTSLSVPEIAEELFISPHTVRTHIKNIYSKLGVNRRLDVIQAAKEHHLI
jgi:LuxR family maltose regulon positive regulatory protein